jgi:hypothetical protein
MYRRGLAVVVTGAHQVDPRDLWLRGVLESRITVRTPGPALALWCLEITVKRWFNRRWPYHRLCLRSWCMRGQTYNLACHRHQGPSSLKR